MKIVLAGGSGFMGTMLQQHYAGADEVIVLSRSAREPLGNVRTVVWNGRTTGSWVHELEGADLLINLTGKTVNCRYTEANKQAILSSRLDATRVLGEAIQKLERPVKVWIQCTSATIYRHAEDHAMDEATGETGSGFSVDVCKQWEQVLHEQPTPHTRKVILRVAFVLGRSGSALVRLVNLVRAGLGGRMGSGRQYISWIHEADVAGCIDWVYANPAATGIYNCSAPGALPNADFMKALCTIYNMPLALRTPRWLLTLGAKIIGTETELILKSRWVIPARFVREGYRFRYPSIDQAFHQLFSNL